MKLNSNKTNVTMERIALRELMENPHIVIKKSDEGPLINLRVMDSNMYSRYLLVLPLLIAQ